MLNFTWDLISQSFISTDIVDIGNIFTSQEPTSLGCTSLVKENLRVVLRNLIAWSSVGFC